MFNLVIFDLDDVLYPEWEYVISGFRVVSKEIFSKTKDQEMIVSKMIEIYKKNPKHVFDELFSILNKNSIEKEKFVNKMINVYRNHNPSISLYSDVIAVLKKLKNNDIKTAIITDGHKESQKLKINSLHLEGKIDKIIITDSLGPNKKFWKPHPHAFEMVLEKFNVNPINSCYIADNPKKDFEGPTKLGMHTIQIRRPNGIYFNETPINNQNCPEFIIHSLNELNLLEI